MSRLLVGAKDHNDFLSQTLLQQLFSQRLFVAVQQLVERKSISHVVISPLRKQRIVEGVWHPALLLYSVVDRLARVRSYPFSYSVLFSGLNRRRAHIPTLQRLGGISPSSLLARSSCISDRDGERFWKLREISGVLFIDDVLTSGGFAKQLWEASPEAAQKVPWHILTLFRSPISSDLYKRLQTSEMLEKCE